jgi:putative salt-induced outer membrane protein
VSFTRVATAVTECSVYIALPPVTIPVADNGVPIPAAIKAMLDAALASGNEADVSTIVRYARLADPASADAVLKIAQTWRTERAAVRDTKLREADIFELWTGRAEIGGFRTTGTSNTIGGSGVVDLQREGLRWRHKFGAQADYQESLGITSRERYLISYEPNVKLDDRAYLYGAAQYESDRFLGYTDRVSASAGAGYSLLKKRGLSLDIELGPAYRYTAATDDDIQSSAAARGSLDFRWQLLPGLSLRQDAAAYVQRSNSTLSGTTALNARLIGPLSAQLTYNVQYESTPPEGRVSTGTTTRAGVVYSF